MHTLILVYVNVAYDTLESVMVDQEKVDQMRKVGEIIYASR